MRHLLVRVSVALSLSIELIEAQALEEAEQKCLADSEARA